MSLGYRLEQAYKDLGMTPAQRLPEEGVSWRTVNLIYPNLNNVEIRVMPKAEAIQKGVTQRTRARCPACGIEFALGNLNQHMYGNSRRLPGGARTQSRQKGCPQMDNYTG